MHLIMQFEVVTLFNRLKFVFTKKMDILKLSFNKISKTMRMSNM